MKTKEEFLNKICESDIYKSLFENTPDKDKKSVSLAVESFTSTAAEFVDKIKFNLQDEEFKKKFIEQFDRILEGKLKEKI